MEHGNINHKCRPVSLKYMLFHYNSDLLSAVITGMVKHGSKSSTRVSQTFYHEYTFVQKDFKRLNGS